MNFSMELPHSGKAAVSYMIVQIHRLALRGDFDLGSSGCGSSKDAGVFTLW